jgi:hypothetical protein
MGTCFTSEAAASLLSRFHPGDGRGGLISTGAEEKTSADRITAPMIAVGLLSEV